MKYSPFRKGDMSLIHWRQEATLWYLLNTDNYMEQNVKTIPLLPLLVRERSSERDGKRQVAARPVNFDAP